MLILEKKIRFEDITKEDGYDYFPDDRMVKAVADVDNRILAVNAGLHADLEEELLKRGSKQQSLYGFNIYEGNEIEYD